MQIFMQQKDFYPYTLISENPESLELALPKGRKAGTFVTFRVMPLVLLAFSVSIPENFRRDLGDWMYWGVILCFYAVFFGLVFHRYTTALTFSRDSLILGFNLCYFDYNETEGLCPGDEILVAKERAGQGAYWMFYLVRQGQKKKRLFSIPATLAQNRASRDNFIAIFEQKYQVKTTVQE